MSEIVYTPIYSTEQIRNIEDKAFERKEHSPEILMKRAGKYAFNLMVKKWPSAKKIIVVCGSGNNGGDGYILAKHAKMDEIDVDILQIGKHGTTKEATRAFHECEKLGIQFISNADFKDYDLIVDAMLGIGLKGESLDKEYDSTISRINSSRVDVLSIDCPSGINTNTGQPLGNAVKATVTCTFIGHKKGLFTGKAKDYCGKIILKDLDIPEDILLSKKAECSMYDYSDIKKLLPQRSNTFNKKNNGHLLIIGGNFGFAGAATLACEAALRCGAGLLSLITKKEHIAGVISRCPEIMAHGTEDKTEIQNLIEKSNAIVIGPGLGQDKWAQEMFKLAIESLKPILIDADALNILSKSKLKKNENWILTPHAGEAARLMNITSDEIEKDRFKSIKDLRKKYGGSIILKGAGSLILGKSETTSILKYGNPGMGVGGMGDILSGIIGSLLAQGLKCEDATLIGANIHSYAADLASAAGIRGMLPTDVIKFLRKVIN